MKEKADSMGVDLLLVDTGDRIEGVAILGTSSRQADRGSGNGLYEGSNPVGKYTSEIFKQQEIDVSQLLCPNHSMTDLCLWKVICSGSVPNSGVPPMTKC
jgi:hypothetical protein